MSPCLPSSSLCCHTLADLRFLLHHLAPRRLTPRTVGLLLRIAAAPAGVDRKSLQTFEMKRLRLYWEGRVERGPDRIRPLPALYADLGVRDAGHAASVGRVFRAMVKAAMPTWQIGALIHASQPGGIMRKDLITGGWTMDLKNRRQKTGVLLALGLLRCEQRSGRQDGTGQPRRFFLLTPAGEKLLLGQWGKAAETRRGDEGTGRLGETEGRMAA